MTMALISFMHPNLAAITSAITSTNTTIALAAGIAGTLILATVYIMFATAGCMMTTTSSGIVTVIS